jgi:glyoxylase I family protein
MLDSSMAIESIIQIDYVILPCRDMRKMRDFYLNVMRFALVEDQESWVKFQVGSGFLTLRPRGQWRGWHDGDMAPGTVGVQVAFRVAYDEVDQCHAELVERGVEVVDPPRDQAFGHRTLFFKDPDGNALEIYAEFE